MAVHALATCPQYSTAHAILLSHIGNAEWPEEGASKYVFPVGSKSQWRHTRNHLLHLLEGTGLVNWGFRVFNICGACPVKYVIFLMSLFFILKPYFTFLCGWGSSFFFLHSNFLISFPPRWYLSLVLFLFVSLLLSSFFCSYVYSFPPYFFVLFFTCTRSVLLGTVMEQQRYQQVPCDDSLSLSFSLFQLGNMKLPYRGVRVCTPLIT